MVTDDCGKEAGASALAPMFRSSRLALAVGFATLVIGGSMSSSALAAKDGLCKDGTPRPCKPDNGQPPTGETAGNNLSFPLILSDNVGPAAFPADGAWRFATIDDPYDVCIGEEGVTAGTPVPPEYPCYFGRLIKVVSEEGEVGIPEFDPEPENPDYCLTPQEGCKVWWLQKRATNFWKALSVGHDVSTPLVVSAVDVGDLLESTPAIQARQIRVEFNLLQNVPADDPELGQFLVTDWSTGIPSPCVVPTAANQSLGCLAALGMSGAVPGTEQSGNEMQGTDFGPGTTDEVGTQTLLDPTTIRAATPADGSPAIPIHALVYSHCARLVIQKIDGEPIWDESLGQWAGPGVGAPLVNVAAYSSSNAWSVEITSGGSIVYGYNWNAKTASTGTYRLTMVLDGNDAEGPGCQTALATRFETPVTGSQGTRLVNQGENNPSTIVYAGDSDLGDEGGLVYIDLDLTTKGGGGGKPDGGRP